MATIFHNPINTCFTDFEYNYIEQDLHNKSEIFKYCWATLIMDTVGNLFKKCIQSSNSNIIPINLIPC